MADNSEPILKGDKAPDVLLKDQDGNDFKLADQKGKKVLLSFHPLAFTDFCTLQMLSIEVNYDNFTKLNTVPVGISIDSGPIKKAWSDSMKLKQLKILSDFWPNGAVCRAYGMFRDQYGTAKRANVIVDENGIVTWVKVYKITYLPDINEVIEALK
jgi:peroxiredoxin